MAASPYLTLEKPVSVLEKGFQVDVKGLFKTLTKGATHIITGKTAELIGDTGELLTALNLKDEPGVVAWVLVRRALQRAMISLTFEANLPLGEMLGTLEPMASQIDDALNSVEVELSPDFFNKPRQMPILPVIEPHFKKWLMAGGASEVTARATASRLPGYFVFALGEEWVSAPGAYAETLKVTEHPFAKAGEWEVAWFRYNGYLQQQIESRLFDMDFTLRQLYIPLRASYPTEPSNGDESDDMRRQLLVRNRDEKRILVDLQTELDRWVNAARKEDAVRLIHGGPGSGKSSFLKMYATYRAELSDTPRVVYLPLHLLDHKGDLVQAVSDHLRGTQLLPFNLLTPEGPRERLLLLFDGLDELALQGKLGAESAGAFAQEVLNKLNLWNAQTLRVQVILSGRDVAVQACSSSFRGAGKMLHVEPYLIDRKNFDEIRTSDGTDQRILWWQTYGELMGKGYTNIPDELQENERLDEVTKWPLLNHLVALSYEGGHRDFSNLNRVYGSLVKDVYKRAYEIGKTHKAVSNLTESDFIRILEEIALASWHGRGRTTTVREITEHCERSNLKGFLDKFQGDQKDSKVAQLLLAFYFRQAGTVTGGDAAYEFTHKTFGEYLTACRLVRGIKRIHKEVQDHKDNADAGWSEKQALEHWIDLCGPTAMDLDLLRFLREEVAIQPSYSGEWQNTLTELLNYLLRNGLPIEKRNLSTFKEMKEQARNATESLIAGINACVLTRKGHHPVSVIWPNNLSAKALLNDLDGDLENNIIRYCFVAFNLRLVGLRLADLSEADLRLVSLSGTNLSGADLSGTDLSGADLSLAFLIGADLSGTNLRRANLSLAYLREADLSGANLIEANLIEANLREADLREAVNLTQEQLDSAITNENTKVSPPLVIKNYQSNV